MTHGGDIAADQPFARAWEMLQRLWLLITCAFTNPSLLEARFAEIEAEIARGVLRKLKASNPAFADVDEASVLMTWRNGRYDFDTGSQAGPTWADVRALGRHMNAARKQRIEQHRRATIAGRFYKRRTRSNWIFCMEGRTAAPRARGLTACARTVPVAPINPAPP